MTKFDFSLFASAIGIFMVSVFGAFMLTREHAPDPRPPSCMVGDVEVPKPKVSSSDPSVFLGGECKFVKCVWLCSHDGIHVFERREEPCFTDDALAKPFMRLAPNGQMSVIIKNTP